MERVARRTTISHTHLNTNMRSKLIWFLTWITINSVGAVAAFFITALPLLILVFLGSLIGSEFLPVAAAYGAVLGLIQLLALRKLINRYFLWTLGSSLGWALAWFSFEKLMRVDISINTRMLIAGTLLGFSSGIIQWIGFNSENKGWLAWIAVSTIAWGLAFFVNDYLTYGSSVWPADFFALAGLIYALVTWTALSTLVRQPDYETTSTL